MVVVKLLVFALICLAGWALTMKGVPRAFVGIGRLLGFRMTLSPLSAKRVERFKSIRRGFVAFSLLCTAIVMSLFLELYVNRRPLYIRYGDNVQLPAVASWLNKWVPFAKVRDRAESKDFGFEGQGELPYRKWMSYVEDSGELERAIADAKAEDDEELTGRLEAFKAMVAEGRVGFLRTLHPFSPQEQLLEMEGFPPHLPFQRGKPFLGTDFEGKELLSQLAYGFRVSISFALVVAFFGYLIGVTFGAVMGYFGGWIDILLQRFLEVWSAMPFLYVMMILASIMNPSFWVLCGMLIVLSAWLGITYTMRGEFYREKARDYVQAARSIGVGAPTIMRKHILPNAMVPIVTYLPFSIVGFITVLVSLDFLGFGLPVSEPSWGRILRQGQENVVSFRFLIYEPVIAFAGTLFCVVTIGEAVREAFDPKKYARLR